MPVRMVDRLRACYPRAAALAVGLDSLTKLVEHFIARGEPLYAAKVEFVIANTHDDAVSGTHAQAALALIDEHKLDSTEAMQLELNILAGRALFVKGAEQQRSTQQVVLKDKAHA